MEIDPGQLALETIDRIINKIGPQTHAPGSWRIEPPEMHLKKAGRHALTAILLMEHPEFTKDDETAIDHVERLISRASMALAILKPVTTLLPEPQCPRCNQGIGEKHLEGC